MNPIINTKVTCKLCNQLHELEYQFQRNTTKHLVYRCSNRKYSKDKAVEFLPMRENLPIKSYSTQEIPTNKEPQIPLFNNK